MEKIPKRMKNTEEIYGIPITNFVMFIGILYITYFLIKDIFIYYYNIVIMFYTTFFAIVVIFKKDKLIKNKTNLQIISSLLEIK